MFINRLPSIATLPPIPEVAPILEEVKTFEIKGSFPFANLLNTSMIAQLPENEKISMVENLSNPNNHTVDFTEYKIFFEQRWYQFSNRLLFYNVGLAGTTLIPAVSKGEILLSPNSDGHEKYKRVVTQILNSSEPLETIATTLIEVFQQMEAPPYFPLACAIYSNLWEILPFLLEEKKSLPQPTDQWRIQHWDYQGGTYPEEGPFNIFDLAKYSSQNWKYVAILAHLTNKETFMSPFIEQNVKNKLKANGLSDWVYSSFLAINYKR